MRQCTCSSFNITSHSRDYLVWAAASTRDSYTGREWITSKFHTCQTCHNVIREDKPALETQDNPSTTYFKYKSPVVEGEEKYTIEWFPNIVQSRALRLVPAAWEEMFENETIDQDTMPVDRANPIIVARDATHNHLVGFIHYQQWGIEHPVWISLSYVTPLYRRKGIYQNLFEGLKARARASGHSSICSGVRTGNTNMLFAASAANRKLVAHTLETNL